MKKTLVLLTALLIASLVKSQVSYKLKTWDDDYFLVKSTELKSSHISFSIKMNLIKSDGYNSLKILENHPDVFVRGIDTMITVKIAMDPNKALQKANISLKRFEGSLIEFSFNEKVMRIGKDQSLKLDVDYKEGKSFELYAEIHEVSDGKRRTIRIRFDFYFETLWEFVNGKKRIKGRKDIINLEDHISQSSNKEYYRISTNGFCFYDNPGCRRALIEVRLSKKDSLEGDKIDLEANNESFSRNVISIDTLVDNSVNGFNRGHYGFTKEFKGIDFSAKYLRVSTDPNNILYIPKYQDFDFWIVIESDIFLKEDFIVKLQLSDDENMRNAKEYVFIVKAKNSN